MIFFCGVFRFDSPIFIFFFFFKQKTAYELRISDWSSDVCSSDLFLDVPLKKMRTVVLVERSHKSYPVHIDFTGMQLSTVTKEHVQLVLNDKEEAVYLT